MGDHLYLGVPDTPPLTRGHLVLAPAVHGTGGSVALPPAAAAEDRRFRDGLAAVAAARSPAEEVVFLEVSTGAGRGGGGGGGGRRGRDPTAAHTVVHAVPLPAGVAADARAYFWHALTTADDGSDGDGDGGGHGGGEGGANGRVRRWDGARPLRTILPRGLPYVAVWFGVAGGGMARVLDRPRGWSAAAALRVLEAALRGADARGGGGGSSGDRGGGDGDDGGAAAGPWTYAAQVAAMTAAAAEWAPHDWTVALDGGGG